MKIELKTLDLEFKRILKVASEIAFCHNFSIYLVGGIARDLLLKRPVFDLDIVVEGDAISFGEKMADHFNQKLMRHHSFKTATLTCGSHKVDLATARREHYPHPGALPKVKPASLKDDLFRRDFTINAMAISLNRQDYGKLFDFYGGLNDLRQKLIKVLHPESFFDDGLRILRAIRFEQRFQFKIEPKTYSLMLQAVKAGALSWINRHRVRDELILFFSEDKPYRYLKRLYQLERLNFISKKVALSQDDFKFFIRAQLALNYYRRLTKKRPLKVWIIYLAKIFLKLPEAKMPEVIESFGFKKGEKIIISSIKSGLKKIPRLKNAEKPSQIYQILQSYSYEAILFFYAYFNQKKIRGNIRIFFSKLTGLKLKAKGKDLKQLGMQPSSAMGKVLKELFHKKLDAGLKTKQQELALVKKKIIRTKKSKKK